jgi:hypothetical protein
MDRIHFAAATKDEISLSQFFISFASTPVHAGQRH